MFKLGDTITQNFTTSAATGAAVDADAPPVGTVYKDGTADALAVTVTNISTGRYKAEFTPAAGFAAGDVVGLVVAATIAAVACEGSFGPWRLEAQDQADLNTAIGTRAAPGAEMALTSAQVTAIVTEIFAKNGLTAVGTVTFATMVKLLYAMARGKTVVSGTTHELYDDDGTTLLATFNIVAGGRTPS